MDARRARRITRIEAVEQGFSLTVTSLGVPFVGVVDLVAHLDGKRTVIDFKTAARDYEEHTVVLSDQLTAYALAKPEAEQVALCVFAKGATPRVEWHLARREGPQIAEYLRKATVVGHAIGAGHFYKRRGGGAQAATTCRPVSATNGRSKRRSRGLPPESPEPDRASSGSLFSIGS